MEQVRNIKLLAKKHISGIHRILLNRDRFWDKLQNKFQSKMDLAYTEAVSESSIPILIGRAELGEENSIEILNFIDDSILQLETKIPTNLYSIYEDMVAQMVLEFDKQIMDNPNAAYLNWLAELLAIDKLLESNEYEIVNFESLLTNGKRADFELKSKNGITSYIDVVSLHIKEDKAETKEMLKQHIDSKLTTKISNKFGDIDRSDKFILPVFWFDYSIIDKVVDYIETSDLESENIISPCRLTFFHEDDLKPHFGTIVTNS